MSLTPDDFRTFFGAVYGYSPFPWQTRLVDEIVNFHDHMRICQTGNRCGIQKLSFCAFNIHNDQ